MLELARFTRAGIQNGILYFGFGSVQKSISEPSKQSALLKIASYFINPLTKEKAIELAKNEDLSLELVNWAIDFLIENHFLLPAGTLDEKSRYHRSLLFYSLYGNKAVEVQKTLQKKSVAILGCGGIGNIVAVNLVTSGIGQITLIDGDTVELSNLTRQILFTEQDAGEYKIKALSAELNKRHSECKINAIAKTVSDYDDLQPIRHVDFIVLSADAGPVIDLVNKFSLEYSIPFLNIGYIEDIAVWGPLVIPGKTSCMSCQNVVANEKPDNTLARHLQLINKRYQPPSVGPVNMTAGALASLDILRFLGDFGEIQSKNKRIGLWTHNLKIQEQAYDHNPNCHACSHRQGTPHDH